MDPKQSSHGQTVIVETPEPGFRRPTRLALVVDDDITFCAVMSEILRLREFVVVSAFSVKEAYALLKGIVPDLILLDIMMPETDGVTLLRRLRSSPAWSNVPAIVVSAMPSNEIEREIRSAGADAFLQKPITMTDLKEIVEPLLPPLPDSAGK